jgi:hypothetical protein
VDSSLYGRAFYGERQLVLASRERLRIIPMEACGMGVVRGTHRSLSVVQVVHDGESGWVR